MLIPRGETIHESLATSYVLVDALVADLCEGGFSGVVEVVLRDTDSFITIAAGVVAAVVEKRGDQDRNGAAVTYARTTVEHLSERSRRERGRVSIYSYPAPTAIAVAGRINAQPLYVGLSTEFTDLEKMIGKLVREHDREWFIEINNDLGPAALIHMRDSRCGIISSKGEADSGPLDLAGNTALGKLVDECTRAGGTFDVYFTRATETVDGLGEQSPLPLMPESLPAAIVNEASPESKPVTRQSDAPVTLAPDDLLIDSSQDPFFTLPDFAASALEREQHIERSHSDHSGSAATQPSFAAPPEGLPVALAEASIGPQPGDLSLVRDEVPPAAADTEAMTEIKRLMGEIARAIEEAAQSVGRPDSFSMSLRAGQLKIADRFPFLDPFAGEFEYLAGEIVFVGRATAEQFVAGFTEALKLAAEAVTRSTAYPDRFHAYVAEDLQKLLARERAGFEMFGLDRVVAEIGNF